MRNDPRRRFVFGLTMENTNVRFWFHDRATVVVSEKFDIHIVRLYLLPAVRCAYLSAGLEIPC